MSLTKEETTDLLNRLQALLTTASEGRMRFPDFLDAWKEEIDAVDGRLSPDLESKLLAPWLIGEAHRGG
jgi:hypothetical protein